MITFRKPYNLIEHKQLQRLTEFMWTCWISHQDNNISLMGPPGELFLTHYRRRNELVINLDVLVNLTPEVTVEQIRIFMCQYLQIQLKEITTIILRDDDGITQTVEF